MLRSRHLIVAVAAAVLVAACGSSPTLDPRTWFSRSSETSGATPREVPGVEARLRPIGTALTGVVRARESGDLLIVRVELVNLRSGPHRVVFHADGNCSSPNGFSAGAPWTPPGAKDPPGRLIPEVYANSEGNAILTTRLRGVRLGSGEAGLEKRSVLIYEGLDTTPPKPSVPNNVIACGVFERASGLFS
jgi:Cu/Zn superoxide dismutase